jgi:hypothetical protein
MWVVEASESSPPGALILLLQFPFVHLDESSTWKKQKEEEDRRVNPPRID